MATINKGRFAGWLFWAGLLLFTGGCTASMQARSAYLEAEQLAAEENYDRAVEKYFEASELEPGSKNYKLKLVASRTRAAANHIRRARALTGEGRLAEALAEYRLAKGFDPSVEIASQEAQGLQNILDAERLAEEAAGFYAKRNLPLTKKALDGALKRDAGNARALAVKELLEREQKSVVMDGVELDVASSEPITLSFKDANIKEVFSILSQLSGINFIFDEGIRSQSVSVLLEKASFAQAMQLILQMNGLGKKVLNSRTIIIYPQNRDKEKQYEDQLIQTFYLSHIDAKKAVNLLRTMLQLRKIYVHEERNALVVRDKPEVIRLAEQILLAADRADAEVLFDVEVLAVRDQDSLNFGPKLSAYRTSVGFSQDGENIIAETLSSGSATTGLITSLNNLQTFYTIPTASFDLAKTLSTTELLASPKIRVKNNEKAKVHIGKRDPIVTTTNIGTSDQTTQNVQYVDSGIKLDIEPNVQLDGTVLTKIKLEVSSAERLDSGNKDGTSPVALTTTNAETSLALVDGERTILGGLFESNKTQNKSTIPFIGDIPLLGSLFTSFANNDEKREIILSITPYIVKKVEVPGMDVATIWSGGEDNLKAGPNFGAFAEPLLSEIDATRPLAAPAVKPLQIASVADGESALLNAGFVPVADEVAAADGVSAPALPGGESAVVPLAPLDEATESEVMSIETEAVPAETEVVPAEVLTEQAGLAQPMVLEMPPKPPASIRLDGPRQIAPGAEFTLAVAVKDIEQLYSAPLFVSYDPAAVELLSVTEGDFLKQDGQATVFSSSPNRSTGQVIVGYKQGAGGQGVSGSGTLFNLTFRALVAGTAKLAVNRINFRNPAGVRLQVVPEVARIEIR